MRVLIDPAGRRIRKLRISLTDACQFRCFYCMPQAPRFLPHRELLPPAELLAIVGNLVDQGIDELRLTGGEPTVRPELLEIVRGLAALPVRRLGMTSNAARLAGLLPALKEAGLTNLNISMDSLRPEVFARVTGSRTHRDVVEAIRSAREMGFEVKVNAVLFRGLNDAEAPAFLRFAEEEGVPVRFLELMRIGPHHESQRGLFISAGEVIQGLREAGELLEPLPGPPDTTAFEYRTAGGGRVGFIASESRPFCAGCSRLRLSATGELRACLMKTDSLSLRGLPVVDYPEVLSRVMALKPLDRVDHVDQPMVQIGG